MKNYCIFARKKDDPTDIIGMVENSFSMGWSKERVCIWNQPTSYRNDAGLYHKRALHELKNHMQTDYHGNSYYCSDWSSERINSKGQMKRIRKKVTDYYGRDFHPCGRSYNEYWWHWVNHYARRVKKPKGYDEVIVCRVNSKHCPVKVDMSDYDLMNKGKMTYNKYNWRNAKFILM